MVRQSYWGTPQEFYRAQHTLRSHIMEGHTMFDARKTYAEELARGNPDPLASTIFQAVGAASMCWENLAGAGVFDDRAATQIGDSLVKFVRDYGHIIGKDKVEIYRDSAGKHRYRVIAANGKIVDASQGYATRWGAKRAVRRDRPNHQITVLQTVKGKR